MIFTLLLLVSCLGEVEDGYIPPIPAQTTPMICEGDFFIRMGDLQFGNSFFIGDQQTSFYSLTADKIFEYDVDDFQLLSQKFFISGVSFSDFAPLNNQTGWLLTRSAISNTNRWMVNLLDADGTSIVNKELDINPAEHAIAATPADNGFILVTNTTAPDRYSVSKHSSNGTEVWKKELTNRGVIKKILQLSDGSFLVGGLTFSTVQGATSSNSFLAKLDNTGNEVWKKESHLGDFNNRYSVVDIIEEANGNFYLLLLNERLSLSLVKADVNYNIEWTTIIDSQVSFTTAKMMTRGDDIIVYHSSGNGQNESDIFLNSLSADGDVQWKRKFGGTGYEEVYDVLPTAAGFFILGRTSNWDGVNFNPTISSYVIKTDQEGLSCK